MKRLSGLLTILPIVLLTACATEPPAPDPIREELTILQKQLLEVQKTSNETKLKLDEATNTLNTLNAKIKELEENQVVRPAPQPAAQVQPVEKAAPAPAKKKPVKKPVKKKKKQPVRSPQQ